jgi:hypothetical protein
MTRAEIVTVVALAGPEARGCFLCGTPHDAGHRRPMKQGIAIAALRFGVRGPFVRWKTIGESTEHVENPRPGKSMDDTTRARGIAMLALPDAEPREVAPGSSRCGAAPLAWWRSSGAVSWRPCGCPGRPRRTFSRRSAGGGSMEFRKLRRVLPRRCRLRRSRWHGVASARR